MSAKAGRTFLPLPDNAPWIIKLIFEEKERQSRDNISLSEDAGIARNCISNLRRVATGVRFSTAETILNALGLPSYEDFFKDWVRRGRPELHKNVVSKGQVTEPNTNQSHNGLRGGAIEVGMFT